MKRIISTTFACLFFLSFVKAQAPGDYFVTIWDLSIPGSGATTLSINVGTSGTVNYIWETIPAGTSGSGTFSGSTLQITNLPANAKIRLKIAPSNFNRIYLYYNSDKARLLDVEQWGTVLWSTMQGAFFDCSNLNITATDLPNLSNVTDMSNMFRECDKLNGPTNIGNWNTQNVTNMSHMFYRAYSFNQPIGNWNTQNVINMTGMFFHAHSFNQPIGNWNTQNVTKMGDMFYRATSFNQSLENWNTENVTDMSNMFNKASSFNQSLGNWVLKPLVDMMDMLENSGMDCANYSATLISWANNSSTPNNLDLGAQGLKYSSNAVAARNALLAKGWTFEGDALDIHGCSTTTSLLSAEYNKPKVSIYPNPAHDHAMVSADGFTQLEIYDLHGQFIKRDMPNREIELSGLRSGLYYVKLSNGSESKMLKLVVE
ncbi:MAG: BspA family leucine-rich repeat surface protein [Cytophagaceae bacterium]|nr:BspA family leucine-rich repeat surface protein [Cytophagaceae bacterium]MDW8456427.1 BspA family leucine-rich repeat surface protein [Cytophagaceae bacterium]